MLIKISACFLICLTLVFCFTVDAQVENGIHVGAPKVYDSRALTLMLNDIGQSLKNPNFIDPAKLAAALGNLSGYNSQDFSQQFNARGAVGPQAATVVAGVNSSGGTGNGANAGLNNPSLPTLETPPAFTPNFGSNAGDLLADEVSLTYQYNNIRMLLDRSLTDRLYDGASRLQGVLGFDVDLEPPSNATDAVAMVDVTVTMDHCGGALVTDCRADGNLALVALMPEEGSHNAATLSQKADAFGGAIAAKIFSVGYAAQKRSQVFFLYRDMDTLSYQVQSAEVKSVHFGWQFRPVLGRHSVTPGMRHMMAVVALPSKDLSSTKENTPVPALKVVVKTRWIPYQAKTQTTKKDRGLFQTALPEPGGYEGASVGVLPTDATQQALGARISQIEWVPTDASTGIAIVHGMNFFPGTKVTFGSKVYATESDGLVIKSDHQLEVSLPVSAAVAGGVLSGRYGAAKPLEARAQTLPSGFRISKLQLFPEGTDMYQLFIDLTFTTAVTVADLEKSANSPVVLVKGTVISTPPSQRELQSGGVELSTFVPASLVQGGATTVTVTYPFSGSGWTASLPHYDPSVNVTRLGGVESTRLLVSVNDKTLDICDASTTLQLDAGKTIVMSTGGALTALTCFDLKSKLLSFDIKTSDLRIYKKFALVSSGDKFPVLVADIPAAAPVPVPSLDKNQTISVGVGDVKSVTFTGSNLDLMTKVLFGTSSELTIVSKKSASISIMLTKDVTSSAGTKELQLNSDGNDSIMATLTVTATPPVATTPQVTNKK